MPIRNLFKVSQADRYKFCSRLIDSSAPRVDFYFLVILSTLIVALGLMGDNIILVIGGMLVTPLLSPVLAIALGVVINDHKLIVRSIKIFVTSFAFAFVVAFITGTFGLIDVSKISLIRIMQPSLFTFFVAVVAGLAVSYTWVKPNLNSTLPGIAITVTLIPPLTAIGLAVVDMDWVVFISVSKVLLLNLSGIIVASLVVFSLMELYKAKHKIIEEVKEEEKEMQKEKLEVRSEK